MKASSPEMRLDGAPLSPELSTSARELTLTEDEEQMLATDPSIGELSETTSDTEADPLSPEAEAFAKVIGGVAVRAEDALLATVVAGTDQAEAHANFPLASAEDFVLRSGTDKNGKTTRAVYAVMPDGSQKRTSYDNMLIERGYNPSAYKEYKAELNGAPTTEIAEATEVTSGAEITTESERTMSGRRVLDTKEVVADNPDDQALIESLTTGKIADLGTKLTGMKDLRASRKEIIAKQNESMKEIVSDAKGDVWNARGRRLGNWKQNNFIKRIGQRSDKRAEYRDKAFNAIDNSHANNPRKALMRLQARKNAWKSARENVRTTTEKSFEDAKNEVDAAKDARDYQKTRASRVRFSPIRRRTTLGGAGSASIGETWSDSGSELHRSEEAKQKDLAKRMAELQKNRDSAKAREKWSTRSVDKQKSERS